jgi:hypothetical protein
MPRRSLRPQHSTLQPACLRRRPQRLLRLQQRSNSPNLCNSAVCPCCHYVTSIALRERLNLDTPPPAYIVPTAARRQLQSLRYSDARPCGATFSALHPATRLTRMQAPAASESPAAGQQVETLLHSALGCIPKPPRHHQHRFLRATRLGHTPRWRTLCLQQHGDSFDPCDTRMHAPAATTSSVLNIATCSTRTHAPATPSSPATGQQLQSLLSTPAICLVRAQPRRTATRQARTQPRRLHAPQRPLHSRHHNLRPQDRPSDAQ